MNQHISRRQLGRIIMRIRDADYARLALPRSVQRHSEQ